MEQSCAEICQKMYYVHVIDFEYGIFKYGNGILCNHGYGDLYCVQWKDCQI